MEFVKYYRVQGGDGFSKSREMIKVTNSNNINVAPLKRIHIGDEKHNRCFTKIRLEEKWRHYSGIKSKNASANVIVMYFPKFFADLLRTCAIPEYFSTGKDSKAPPHTVDLKKGEAYALFGSWNLIMQACNLYAQDIPVFSENEIDNIYSNVDISKFHPIDIQMLKNFLTHASERTDGITEEKIQEIIEESKRINNEINKSKGEYEK